MQGINASYTDGAADGSLTCFSPDCAYVLTPQKAADRLRHTCCIEKCDIRNLPQMDIDENLHGVNNHVSFFISSIQNSGRITSRYAIHYIQLLGTNICMVVT